MLALNCPPLKPSVGAEPLHFGEGAVGQFKALPGERPGRFAALALNWASLKPPVAAEPLHYGEDLVAQFKALPGERPGRFAALAQGQLRLTLRPKLRGSGYRNRRMSRWPEQDDGASVPPEQTTEKKPHRGCRPLVRHIALNRQFNQGADLSWVNQAAKTFEKESWLVGVASHFGVAIPPFKMLANIGPSATCPNPISIRALDEAVQQLIQSGAADHKDHDEP